MSSAHQNLGYQLMNRRRMLFIGFIVFLSSCMQAEKISLDTSGANGLIAGVLGIQGGFFGAGNAAPPSTDVAVNANGFIYNAGANSHPIQLSFSINQGANTDTCDILTSGFNTCSGIFQLGDSYNVTIASHNYTGGQVCNIKSGSAGTITGSQATVEIECIRSALAFINYTGDKLAYLSIDRTGSHPIALQGSIINGVSEGSPSLLWNGSQYLFMYGPSNNQILVGRRYVDGNTIGPALILSTGNPVTSSAIAYDQTNGRYFIVWIQNNAGNYVVKGQFLSTDGTTLGSIVNLATTTGFNRQDITIVKNNTNYIIAYSEKQIAGNASSIQVKSIPLTDSTVSSGFSYTCDKIAGEDRLCTHPSLVGNDNGALLAWATSYFDGEITANVYQTQLSNNANQTLPTALIAQQSTGVCGPEEPIHQSAKPNIAWSRSTYLVTWEYNCGDVGGVFSWVNAIQSNSTSAVGSILNISPNNYDEYYGGAVNWNGHQFEVLYIQQQPSSNVIMSLRSTDGSEIQKIQKDTASLSLGSITDIYQVATQ